MPKRIPLFQIDQRPLTDIGGAVIDTVDDPAPAAPATLDAPTLSSLSASLARSATTPMALISASWTAAAETTPERYVVQYATDSAFTVAVGGVVAYQTSAAIENLTTGTTYYVRVAAEYRGIQSAWSNVLSVATPADTTPPNPVTGLSASFINTGDLQISWVNSSSTNLKDTVVAIYADNTMTTQLALFYVAAQTYLWTAAQNLAATSQAGDASVFVELRARSWGGIFSTAVNTLATKAAPATPAGLATSWSGDGGTAGADCVISWTAASDAAKYVLTIDGVSRTVLAPRLVYTLDQNVSEHSNIPDPSLSLSLVAVDGLGQSSATPATLVATNVRPPATAVTILPGFNQIAVLITASAAADFWQYLVRIVKDGTTVATARSADPTPIYDVSNYGSGSYQVGVTVLDRFNQASAETLSAAATVEPLTLTDLRIAASYDDDMGTASTVLDALKDANTASGGVTYL